MNQILPCPCSHDSIPGRRKQESRPSGRLSEFGGARRDRTADLLHAMQALSQLSYGPNRCPGETNRPKALTFLFVLRGVADQIGNVVVAFLCLFDERSLF